MCCALEKDTKDTKFSTENHNSVTGLTPPSVLVVCDRPVCLRGIASLIAESRQIMLVGTAGDAIEGYRRTQDLRPSLLVIQSSLIDLYRAQITGESYVPKALVLGVTERQSLHTSSNADWACGFLPPDIGLSDAHRRMLEIARCNAPAIGQKQCGQCAVRQSIRMAPLPLSDREYDVFIRVGSGEGSSQIASALGVSVKTVESYRENIKLKLRLSNAHQLHSAAIQWREGKEVFHEED